MRSPTQQHGGDGEEEQLQIQPEGLVLNVLDIQPNPTIKITIITTCDLPCARQPPA